MFESAWFSGSSVTAKAAFILGDESREYYDSVPWRTHGSSDRKCRLLAVAHGRLVSSEKFEPNELKREAAAEYGLTITSVHTFTHRRIEHETSQAHSQAG